MSSLSGRAFQEGDFKTGGELWDRGLKTMDDAIALEPDNVGVLIPRGATLIAASRHVPNPDQARTILGKGVADYEKVLELQRPYFDKLSVHARGELLIGLAEGWHRLGDVEKARRYFRRIVEECKGSKYEEQARAWLENQKRSVSSCLGCHSN